MRIGWLGGRERGGRDTDVASPRVTLSLPKSEPPTLRPASSAVGVPIRGLFARSGSVGAYCCWRSASCNERIEIEESKVLISGALSRTSDGVISASYRQYISFTERLTLLACCDRIIPTTRVSALTC